MPENYRYRFMIDRTMSTNKKKEEIYRLEYIVSEIYIFSIRFHKIGFVCKYQLREPLFRTGT
jgi:hypothetical protein